MKLYEINLELENLLDQVQDNGGEISAELIQSLDALELQRSNKIANVCLFYKNLQSFQTAVSDEIKNLTQKKKVIDSKIEFLKEYVLRNLREGEKINESNFSISWRKSDAIEVSPFIDLNLLAKQYPDLVTHKIEVQKTKVKDFIKSTGVIPEGIEYKERNNIIIK
jgi:hypothetical protein